MGSSWHQQHNRLLGVLERGEACMGGMYILFKLRQLGHSSQAHLHKSFYATPAIYMQNAAAAAGVAARAPADSEGTIVYFGCALYWPGSVLCTTYCVQVTSVHVY